MNKTPLRLFSDLHIDFRAYKYDHIWKPNSDDKNQILLLAGDVGEGIGALDFVKDLCSHFKHVLMIAGNHEFYVHDYAVVVQEWKEFENTFSGNFNFLHNECKIVDGIRFLGGTMWTNYNNCDPFCIGAVRRQIQDFVQIKNNGEKITTDFVIQEHQKFKEFLTNHLNDPFIGDTVVMSHHSPGNELRRRGRVTDRLGSAYFADLEDLIGNSNISLFVHGHIHESQDYMINNTRVVCNPYGYYNYVTNRNFDPNLVLDL